MTKPLNVPTSCIDSNYRLIHDIYVLLDAGDRRVLAPFGLTTAQYRILTLLHAQPEWRLTDLSQAMLCARSTITRVVDGLEASRWVKRIEDPEDRRAQRVKLTTAGCSILEAAQTAHTQSLEGRLGCFDGEAQLRLMVLLESLRSQLLLNLGVTEQD